MVYIPPSDRSDKEFEKVIIDEWITGEIVDVQEKKNVEKTFLNRETNEKETHTIDQIRLKFKLEGYKYSHYSRWMTASMNEKSNLFKILQQLYGERILPDIGVNLDLLKGVKVKTMWDEIKLADGRMFQLPDKIRAVNSERLPAIWEIPPQEKGSIEEPIIEEEFEI